MTFDCRRSISNFRPAEPRQPELGQRPKRQPSAWLRPRRLDFRLWRRSIVADEHRAAGLRPQFRRGIDAERRTTRHQLNFWRRSGSRPEFGQFFAQCELKRRRRRRAFDVTRHFQTNSGNQPAPPTVARAAAPTDDGRGLGSVLETFMRMITPTPPPFEGETRGGAINSPWPTPPEPPLEELPTFAPSFATHPTLLPNAWSARASHGSSFDGENQASGGGGWVNGVESSSVAAVDLRSSATNSPPPPPPPSSVSSERPPAINSGEAGLWRRVLSFSAAAKVCSFIGVRRAPTKQQKARRTAAAERNDRNRRRRSQTQPELSASLFIFPFSRFMTSFYYVNICANAPKFRILIINFPKYAIKKSCSLICSATRSDRHALFACARLHNKKERAAPILSGYVVFRALWAALVQIETVERASSKESVS